MSFQVIPVPGEGAEDVVVGLQGRDEGAVFTGTDDGGIHRISHDGRRIDRVAFTGGRPLGLELLPDGRLLVCDGHHGLLRVDPATGDLETVADSVGGRPFVFCNNAAVSQDGVIWFSDSSTEFGVERWKDDFVRNTCTGRLLRVSEGGDPEVVLDGLAFANGVALSSDESFVAVAETGARTVVRHWLTGDRAGERDFLVEDLPGYPDNIARGSDGLIWVTIASPTDPFVERIQHGPMPLRKLATRVPERIQPKVQRTVRTQAYDDRGTLVHDIDVQTTDYHMVTGVREHGGRVWMGSLHEPAVAVVQL